MPKRRNGKRYNKWWQKETVKETPELKDKKKSDEIENTAYLAAISKAEEATQLLLDRASDWKFPQPDDVVTSFVVCQYVTVIHRGGNVYYAHKSQVCTCLETLYAVQLWNPITTADLVKCVPIPFRFPESSMMAQKLQQQNQGMATRTWQQHMDAYNLETFNPSHHFEAIKQEIRSNCTLVNSLLSIPLHRLGFPHVLATMVTEYVVCVPATSIAKCTEKQEEED